jgi:hypothetical protein
LEALEEEDPPVPGRGVEEGGIPGVAAAAAPRREEGGVDGEVLAVLEVVWEAAGEVGAAEGVGKGVAVTMEAVDIVAVKDWL